MKKHNTIGRRALLGAALVTPLILSACNGAPPPNTSMLSFVIQDVQVIAKGLGNSLTQISALGLVGLTPAVLDAAQTALAGLQSVASAIVSVASVADAQPLVARVETYVNTFVGALALLPLPAPIQAALVAATILLPVIEAGVNMVVRAPTSSSAMTPDQARATLAAS